MKHYYITTEPPIICNKSEIKENEPYVNNGVIFYADSKFNSSNNPNNSNPRVTDHNFKIIAGLPNQPTIDYSALSDKECKVIGWVDVEKLGLKKWYFSDIDIKAFIDGYKTRESLNDKKWSDEEVKEMLKLACQKGMEIQSTINDTVKVPYFRIKEYAEEQISKTNQPKVFEIEAIVQDNKVKILKVL